MEYTIDQIYTLDTDLRTSNLDIILADAAKSITYYIKNNSSYNNEEIILFLYKFLSETLSKSTNIKHTLIDEILYRLLRHLSIALKIDWEACIKEFTSLNIFIEKISTKKHIEAIMTIISILDININFDIPYLAGYSSINPKIIYIDRGIKDNLEIDKNIIYSLAIHEFIEKILINELKKMPHLYFRTHQIAQRIEEDTVKSLGSSWYIYQNVLMAKEIERAYLNTPKKVPFDLDYTPYIDCKDYNLIFKMKAVSKPRN